MSESYSWGNKNFKSSATWTSSAPVATYVQKESEPPIAQDREELVERLVEESVNVLQDGIESSQDARAIAAKIMECVATVLEEMGLKYGKDKKPLTNVAKTPPNIKAKKVELERKAVQMKYEQRKRDDK